MKNAIEKCYSWILSKLNLNSELQNFGDVLYARSQYKNKSINQLSYILLKCIDCTESSKEISQEGVSDHICLICKRYVCDFCQQDHAEIECFLHDQDHH